MTTPQALKALFAPPLTSNWTRRCCQASAIVGDYLYLDGGEMSVGHSPFIKNGVLDASFSSYAINCTLVLPINASWSDPSDIEFQIIPKPKSPVFNYASFWHDGKTNSLYSYGGEQSFWDKNITDLDLSVWRLDLDGNGGGTWHLNSTKDNAPFSQGIMRPSGGLAVSTNDTGLLVGGYESNHTSPIGDVANAFSVNGLVSYSFSNGSWTNDTLRLSNDVNESIQWGGIQYIPNLGPNGLVVMWGGQTTDSPTYTLGAELRPMNVITLYDPITKEYYQQNITGRVPSSRIRFCSVAVEDPRPAVSGNSTGSWEIFMYSGYGGVNGAPLGVRDYDSIWALTLPSFSWVNIYSDQTGGRYGHSCHVIGKRQMLSVGGAYSADKVPLSPPDYLNLNGIGVFDLSQSQWANGFDADAPDYERPQYVQECYNTDGLYPQTWTDPRLETLIKSPHSPSPSGVSDTPAAATTSTSAASPSHASNRTTVITGSTVGVVGVLLLMTLVLLLTRHRRRYKFRFFRVGPEGAAEMPGEGPKHEIGEGRAPKRVFVQARKHEMPADPIIRNQATQPTQIQSRGRGRSRSQARPVIELDAGEAAKEINPRTPAVEVSWTHHINKTVGDYFSSWTSSPESRDKAGGKWSSSEVSPISQQDHIKELPPTPIARPRPSLNRQPNYLAAPRPVIHPASGNKENDDGLRTPSGGMFGLTSPGIRWKRQGPQTPTIATAKSLPPPKPTSPPPLPKSRYFQEARKRPDRQIPEDRPPQVPPKDAIVRVPSRTAFTSPPPIRNLTQPPRSYQPSPPGRNVSLTESLSSSQPSHKLSVTESLRSSPPARKTSVTESVVSSPTGLRRPGQSLGSVSSRNERFGLQGADDFLKGCDD